MLVTVKERVSLYRLYLQNVLECQIEHFEQLQLQTKQMWSHLQTFLAAAGFPILILFNARAKDVDPTKDMIQISKDLLKAAKVAKADFMEGKSVALVEMQGLANQLAVLPMEALLPPVGEDQALDQHNKLVAFWLNIYNALTIHAALRTYQQLGQTYHPLLSVKELMDGQFFRRAAYYVGPYAFSLEDIEHGILRTNRAGPRLLNLGTGGLGQFFPLDTRRQFVLQILDQRIHFALNCGARSCPPIRAYTPEKVQSQLDIAARAFLGTGGLQLEGNSVKLSPLFLWFSRDFGYTARSRVSSLLPFVDPSQRKEVESISSQHGVVWGDYDWTFG